jgi:hypothetical protein
VRGLADGPGGLLAVVEFRGQDLGQGRLYRSNDEGRTWIVGVMPPEPPPRQGGVVWAALLGLPEGYLLQGRTTRGRDYTWRSAEGESWERVRGVPPIRAAVASAEGTIVGIAPGRAFTTTDLEDWEIVWRRGADTTAGVERLEGVDTDGSGFALYGIGYEGCPERVDECYFMTLLLSPDGLTWSESTGPDGVAGPDRTTWFHDVAAGDGIRLLLGDSGPAPADVWSVPPDAAPAASAPAASASPAPG